MKALMLNHWSEENSNNGIQVEIHEPSSKDGLCIRRNDELGKGWYYDSIDAVGIGKSLSYRNFDIDKPVCFFSEITGPVICLRIEVDSNSIYDIENPCKYFLNWSSIKCKVFYSNKTTVEKQCRYGKLAAVDILFRPQDLVKLCYIPAVERLLKNRDQEGFNIEDDFQVITDYNTIELLQTLLHKLECISPSVDVFNYACDCLLILCLGEDLKLIKRNVYVTSSNSKFPFKEEYKPTNLEREILMELEDETRDELICMFEPLLKEMEEVKESWGRENQLNKNLNEISKEIWLPVREKIARTYLNLAQFLVKVFHNAGAVERKKIQEYIVLSCEHGFQYKDPDEQESRFYLKWAGVPYVWHPIAFEKASRLFFGILSFDSSRISECLDGKYQSSMNQKVDIEWKVGESDYLSMKAKQQSSIEVIQAYERLMLYFSDSLQVNIGNGILRSEIVSELDSAFQNNDLMKLLLIEIFSCTDLSEFWANKTKQELMYLIVAIRSELEYYHMLLIDMEESPAYFELQLVHQLGDNLFSYKKHLTSIAMNEGAIAEGLNKIIFDMMDHYSLEYVLKLASHILYVD